MVRHGWRFIAVLLVANGPIGTRNADTLRRERSRSSAAIIAPAGAGVKRKAPHGEHQNGKGTGGSSRPLYAGRK
jgi:hypothetical protein